MGILGVTHDETGSSLQKLPVAVKISIGEPPNPADPKSHPRRLDHFVFKRKQLVQGKDVQWVAADDITKAYGTNPRSVEIFLMDDNPDNVLRTNYGWWTASECKCSGELVQIGDTWKMQAIRKTEKAPEGELWPGEYKYTAGPKKDKPIEPCGDGCPDLEDGKCKPHGDLYFSLVRFPMVGAICVFRTTSYRSIKNINNALMQIRSITGGRLAGVQVMLHMEPEKIGYKDNQGAKKSSIAHIASLRIDATDMKQLVAHMTETAKLFAATRQLGMGKIDYEPEDTPEKDRALELTEFHDPNPEDEAPAPKAPEPEPAPTEDDTKLKEELMQLCKDLEYNRAKMQALAGQYKGKLVELRDMLKKTLYEKRAAEAKPAEPKDDWLPDMMFDEKGKPAESAPVTPKEDAGQKGWSF